MSYNYTDNDFCGYTASVFFLEKPGLQAHINIQIINLNTDVLKIRKKMKVTAEKNKKIAQMTFASVYPHYINRLEKNGRTKEEFHQVIEWLTGFNTEKIQELIDEKATFETFFQKADLHPNAHLIKGSICGYRIEEIPDEFELYRKCRYLDKLYDELAKGRKMEKIVRVEKN